MCGLRNSPLRQMRDTKRMKQATEGDCEISWKIYTLRLSLQEQAEHPDMFDGNPIWLKARLDLIKAVESQVEEMHIE